jgi:hypothetical protein
MAEKAPPLSLTVSHLLLLALCSLLAFALADSFFLLLLSSLRSSMSSFLPLIILNGLLVLLNAGPLYWQFLQGNSGAISMGVWVMIANVNGFVSSPLLPSLMWLNSCFQVNMISWYGDALNRAPIWCDVSVKVSLRRHAEMGLADLNLSFA